MNNIAGAVPLYKKKTTLAPIRNRALIGLRATLPIHPGRKYPFPIERERNALFVSGTNCTRRFTTNRTGRKLPKTPEWLRRGGRRLQYAGECSHVKMDPRTFNQHNPYLHSWRREEKRLRHQEDNLQPCCSLLTLLVLFLVLLGVLAVSGLALYIGALRLEPVQTLLVFDGSMRLVAEKFTPNLANRSGLQFYEKSKRYQTLLEAVYGKSKLGPALHDLFVTSFANGSLIIFFRIVLDRRKIPKPVSSIEETLRSVILEEASSPLSILNSLQIDSKQLHIKRYIEDRAERPEVKEKETLPSSPNLKWKKKFNHHLIEPTPLPKENRTPKTQQKEVEKVVSIKEDDWHPINPESTVEARGFQGEVEVVQEDMQQPGAQEAVHPSPQQMVHVTVQSETMPSLPIMGEFPDIVTLLPVRSNVGVRSAIRPKPSKRFRINEEEPKISLQSYFPDEFVTEGLKEIAVVTTSSDPIRATTKSSNGHRQGKTLGFPAAQNITGRIENQMRELIEEIIFNISTASPEQVTTLSPVSVKQMAEGLDKLAKLKVSQKAVSSTHHSNTPFRLLTKVLNKAPQSSNTTQSSRERNGCGEKAMLCGSGECIPLQLRCNRLADCRDSSDEKNCTCAQLLRSQLQSAKICDGIHDCADLSDELGCEWCEEGQYHCSNAKLCIYKNKVCDGKMDCPRGDDEDNCISLYNDTSPAVTNRGYLMLRKEGDWGKVCLQNATNFISDSNKDVNFENFGKAVCSALTFKNFVSITNIKDENDNTSIYYELDEESYDNGTFEDSDGRALFSKTSCPEKQIALVECSELKCGHRNEPPPQLVKNERRSRIVGGDNAGPGSWPWQAALYKEGEFQCGATLISNKWLISAAHCFYRAENDYWVARLGALRRGGPPSLYEQSRRVSHVILHPNYQDAGYLHDICLLEMESPLVMTPHVRPICLPSTEIMTGRMCTVVGWGQLSEAGRLFPDTLQEVEVPIISTEECRRRTGGITLYKLTDSMFCAGYERGGRDACLGDSGGPLMCQEPDGHWMLHGVTSNGYGCARANRPGVYTKVAAYLSWIKNSTSSPTRGRGRSRPRCSGHRCPLGECLPRARVCNGYTECSDSSDESLCW